MVVNNKHKKIRFSLRLEFTLIILVLMVILIGGNLLINHFLLRRYYLSEKGKTLVEVFENLNQATQENSIDSEEFDIELLKIVGENSIGVVVMDSESTQVKAYTTDTNTMMKRMWENLVGDTPYLSQSGEEASEASTTQDEGADSFASQFYVMEDVAETENYRIQIIYDERMGTKAMELWGILDDSNFCLLRSTIESIENSSEIANRFIGYVGALLTLLGAVIAFFVAGTLTKPIRELTDISARMRNLDFSAKYTGDNRTEIADLGKNINELSETLERTISELKTANNELRADLERKKKAEDMQHEFLSGVTHELKTPLALIQGYAEGLALGINDDPEGTQMYCDVIMDEAGKMNKMVNKLLSLNQLEFGASEMQLLRFDIVGFIRGCLESQILLAEQKNVKVLMERKEPLYVWADEFMAEEVFTNYFTNAVHHVDGEKVIDIRFEERGDHVRIIVFNTGKPIPEESLPRIWEKFYKVDKARTREYGGSGVGLSIVKAIMELMHQEYGAINYDNGVAFWFELETQDQVGIDSSTKKGDIDHDSNY